MGVAVDDSNNASPLDQGWIMLKTLTISFDGFIHALKHGAFYATTGPEATFSAEHKQITVHTPTPATITFIDGYNQPQKTVHGRTSEYNPEGWEGFIRAEVTTPDGKSLVPTILSRFRLIVSLVPACPVLSQAAKISSSEP